LLSRQCGPLPHAATRRPLPPTPLEPGNEQPATPGDTTATPTVHWLEWVTEPKEILVGDTVQLQVRGFDSKGKEIHSFPVH
jgi:hypothetical protein